MFLTIHIILLLFALGSSAHTLSRIQITNGSDIYEVREKPNNMFEIIEPKPKKPTLREIIFFKVIETPYRDNLRKKLSQEQGPDFDESERPFTNGPGFQFVEFGPIDTHKSDEDDKNNSKVNKNDSDSDSHENRPDSDESKNDSKESKNDSKESKNDSNESKNDSYSGSNESRNDSKEGNNDSKESKNDSHSGSNESRNDSKESQNDSNESKNSDNKNDVHDKNTEIESEDTSKGLTENSGERQNSNGDITRNVSQTKPAAAEKKMEAAIEERNKQFDAAKEKYQETNKKSDNTTTLLRRKRDIEFSMPPPPPALSPLNVGMFPDFIQRMISNIPALRDIVGSDERGEPNDQDETRPRTYGFHLNKDKGHVWNHLPFNDQENYIGDPSNIINKNKNEYQDNNNPDSSSSSDNSGSDDNSLNSDNDSGYSAGTDDGDDTNSDNDSTGGVWPEMTVPLITNFNPYDPITKEKDMNKYANKKSKDTDNLKQDQRTIQHTTENNSQYLYENNETEAKKSQKNPPPKKTKININKDLKEKIEMSFDNIGKMVPPMITRFEENLVKTTVNNEEKPLTFGMKLSGDHGDVWNDLTKPGSHYFIGETQDGNKNGNEPSSLPTNPASTDASVAEANEPTHPAIPDKGTTQIVSESSKDSKSQEPSINSNESNKDSLQKDKDNSDDKKDSEAVQVALDDLLKKDDFWQWLTNWTAAYIEVLNEHVEELVKREVKKQVDKIMNHKDNGEEEKIYTNNKDIDNKNETIANVTTVEPANNTNEINTNTTTTDQSIPELNSTDVNVEPEKDKINTLNKTVSDGHKSNKTTPANPHTIYGNAIDSDHVTNIFIFYPNAENNATAKDIEAILGKTNKNVVVLGNPSNDNTDSKAPDSSTNSPIDDTTGIYAIDKKKDVIPDTSELPSEKNETTINSDSATAATPSKNESTSETNADNIKAASKPDTGDTTPAGTNSGTESNTNATIDASSSNSTESTIPNNTESTNNAITAPANDTSTTSKR